MIEFNQVGEVCKCRLETAVPPLEYQALGRKGLLCLENSVSISGTFLKLSFIMETLPQPAISNHDIKLAQSQQQWRRANEERLVSQGRF